jgi:hypothetical protein
MIIKLAMTFHPIKKVVNVLLIHQMLKMEDDLNEISLLDQIQDHNHHIFLYFEEQKEEENEYLGNKG